jgi:two-component sensor histidine kinase
MYSEATRRTAMQNAMQTGEPAATGRVQLTQDAGSAPIAGALIYFPVYERIQLPNRTMRGRLKGFVYAPMRVPDLLQAALANDNQTARRVELYDGPPAPDNLLAATTTTNRDLISHSTPLEFAGRRWTLVVTSQTASGLTLASRTVLVLGTMISLLTMVVAWMATTRASEDRRVLEWLSRQSAIRTSLTRELNHRVKNTLANVLSIVALTRRRTNDLDEFADGLVGRIRALSATHDLLSQREWSNAPVLDVVTSELAPYLDPEDPHAEVSGPEAHLAPNDALSLGLALHELATNAAKYGALSVAEGRVSVTWTLPGPDRCEVLWQESGGPQVSQPTRRGFGLELIERIVSSELKSQVEIRFEPDGVTCRLQVPRRPEREFALRAPPAI